MSVKASSLLPAVELEGPLSWPKSRKNVPPSTKTVSEEIGIFGDSTDSELTLSWLRKKKFEARDKVAAAKTVTSYEFALKKFAVWRAQYNLRYKDIKADHWYEFSSWMKDNGNTIGGTRSTLQKLKAFFNYLSDNTDGANHISRNPFQKIKKPPLTQQPDEKLIYSPEAFAALLQATHPTHWMGKRDRALFYMARCTGARKGELTEMKVSALHLAEDDTDCSTISVEGKFGKWRTIVIEKSAVPILREYLESRTRLNPNSDALWLSRSKEPLGYAGLTKIGRNYSHWADLQRFNKGRYFRINFWHSFRKTLAQDLAMMPGSNRYAMMLQFGWTTGAMVDYYAAGLDAREGQMAFANVFADPNERSN